jgi:CheY-like chemotaxis protein
VEVGLPEAPEEKLPGDSEQRRVAAVAPGQKTFRILVVDDLPLNRTVLSRLLSSAGFDVREASGGAEAFALWREWNPDLVWMDKRMPGVDGLEATRLIREAEKQRGGRTPIIALSASALEHERGEILAAGCDDFVAKPFREETIFARIAERVGVRYVYESDPAGEPPAPPARDSQAPSRSRHVLLVDDDPICRDVAREVLRIAGVGVTTASSGAEALRILRDSTFDLVLMDVHMADMDGVEAARRIKATIDRRLPVIAMTAETFESRRELAETGMDDYVAKPVEASVLAEVLGRWLPPERPSTERPA